MIFSMIVAAGCQAVDGVNLNQVIKNMTKVKSAEGTYELEFKLKYNEEELIEQAELEDEDIEQVLAQLRQYSHIKLAITEYKVQDETHASLKGALTFGDQSKLGFDLRMTDKLMVINLDGAKQPFSIDLTGERERLLRNHYFETEYGISYEELYGEDDVEYGVEDEDEDMIAAVQQISELVTDYSVGILPNIDRLKVEPATEMINGESVALLNLQGEIKGMELWDWAKKLVNAIASDREGLEKLLNEIYTIVSAHEDSFAGFGSYDYIESGPISYIHANDYGDYNAEDYNYEDYDFDESDVEDDSVIDESSDTEPEMTPEEIQAQVIEELIQSLQELQVSMDEFEKEDQESLKQVLNDSLTIKFNYGIDTSLNVRKQNFSIDYSIDSDLKEELELYGLDGFTLTLSSQMWNVNGSVKALEPVTTLNTVSIESLQYMQGYEAMRLFEEDTFISSILRDQLHITEQIYWNSFDEESDYGLYLNRKKQAMIPAREIIEEFGGSVSYNKEQNRIVLYDDATNTTIEIQTGSRIVIVNGEELQWSAPVEARNNVTFVPARDIADALGADIYWSNEGYVEITREP